MTREQQALAIAALHKLSIEIARGTAQPRAEYDWALAELGAMKAAIREGGRLDK